MRALRFAVLLFLCVAIAAKSQGLAQESPIKGPFTLAKRIVETTKKRGRWFPAGEGQEIPLRHFLRTGENRLASVLFTDASMTKLNEMTEIQILPMEVTSGKPTLSLWKGIIYFFSREKREQLEIRTAAANGASKGTALICKVEGNISTFSLLEGELDVINAQGKITLRRGEHGVAELAKHHARRRSLGGPDSQMTVLFHHA